MATNLRFSLRDMVPSLQCNGYIIVATTDIPCHLYMRWTTVKPQIHTVPILRRGIYLHADKYFCFVTQDDNEQEEAGDTLTHTFIKLNWPICETRYFYFWATIGGVPCVSTTALFSLHFAIDILPFIGSGSNRTAHQIHTTWSVVHDAALAFGLYVGPAPWYRITTFNYLSVRYRIGRAYLFFDTSSRPPLPKPVGGWLSLYVLQHFCTATIGRPFIYITRGVQDDPVTLANYGDQLPFTLIGGQIDLQLVVDGTRNTIPLGQGGLDMVNSGGITRFCLRAQNDVDNVPTPFGNNELTFAGESATAPYRPILTLCYPPA